jgi:hypothetical protein
VHLRERSPETCNVAQLSIEKHAQCVRESKFPSGA